MLRVDYLRDKNGNLVGTKTQEGSKLVERDKYGNRIGYSEKAGDEGTIYRDKNGNRVGSSR